MAEEAAVESAESLRQICSFNLVPVSVPTKSQTSHAAIFIRQQLELQSIPAHQGPERPSWTSSPLLSAKVLMKLSINLPLSISAILSKSNQYFSWVSTASLLFLWSSSCSNFTSLRSQMQFELFYIWDTDCCMTGGLLGRGLGLEVLSGLKPGPAGFDHLNLLSVWTNTINHNKDPPTWLAAEAHTLSPSLVSLCGVEGLLGLFVWNRFYSTSGCFCPSSESKTHQ